MKHELSIKSVKQSAANASKYLQDEGYSIPKSAIYEMLSKVFFLKNWNTLRSKLEDSTADNFKQESKRIVIIEIDCPKSYLITLLNEASVKANCKAPIESILEKNVVFRITFDMLKNYPNTLTMLILMTNRMVKSPYVIKQFHFWDIKQMKEDILPYVNKQRFSSEVIKSLSSVENDVNPFDLPLKRMMRRTPDLIVNSKMIDNKI